MTDTTKQYKCPSCGGAISFDVGTQKMKCPYCANEVDVENLSGHVPEIEWQSSDAKDWSDAEKDALRLYVCSSCGGEIICDATTAATSCPYCDSPVVLESQFSGGLRPELIIPFKYGKDQAVQALYKHYKNKRILPKIFRDKNRIKEIKGVYVPFWMFDATVSAATYYKASKDVVKRIGDDNFVVTSCYSVTVSGRADFKNVPVDSSTKIDNLLTESIEPFNLSEAVEFDMAYLSGFFADKYDVNKDESSKRITERLKDSMYDRMRAKLYKYTVVEKLKREYFTIQKLTAKYLLCPVWILTTEWEGRPFTFVMNGQSGKIAGDLPLSKKLLAKYLTLAFFITGAAAFVISMFILYLLGGM